MSVCRRTKRRLALCSRIGGKYDDVQYSSYQIVFSAMLTHRTSYPDCDKLQCWLEQSVDRQFFTSNVENIKPECSGCILPVCV